MDGKSSRRIKLNERWSRRKHIGSYRRAFVKFLGTHKQPLVTMLLIVVAFALLVGLVSQLRPPQTTTPPNGVTPISYSTLLQQVQAGNVLAVTIQGNSINGLLANPLTAQHTATAIPTAQPHNKVPVNFVAWSRYLGDSNSSWPSTSTPTGIDPAHAVYTQFPGNGDANLMQLLLSNHVMVNTLPVPQPPIWLSLFWKFLPILFLGLILLLVLTPKKNNRPARGMDERMAQMGKSRARRFDRAKETPQLRPTSNNKATMTGKSTTTSTAIAAGKPIMSQESPITFADVAGIDEVRTELEEIVQFLRSPERFDRLGARIPRGALLVGPPGTGKTLLAKAVAGEAGVPFFSMSSSEFVEMFVGVGASRVRDLFNQARQAAPCVIFLDEIDAVGRKRSMRVSGNDERDQTLNQLLVELDGFDGRNAIVVLAATNRVDILDRALLRPGRFDRHITVSLPDRVGREAILKVHTRRTPLHAEVSLERLSRLTTGMSGADLANLVNEAALSAARQNLEHITHNCFEDALSRVQLGALRPIVMGEKDRRIIAYHEGGHALVAHHLPQADRVNRVTILPRGQSLGVTQFTAEEDRYNYSRDTLMARIAVGLGGRAAEELTFGSEHVTTGAENDLQVVTDLARRMVTRWGMSDQLGVVFADYEPGAMSLNMSHLDPRDLGNSSSQSRSLIATTNGQLILNGNDSPLHQQRFAMSISMPATRNPNNSSTMATLIDTEVQRILNDGYTMARSILHEHTHQLTTLADALMEHEQLDRKQFEALFHE